MYSHGKDFPRRGRPTRRAGAALRSEQLRMAVSVLNLYPPTGSMVSRVLEECPVHSFKCARPRREPAETGFFGHVSVFLVAVLSDGRPLAWDGLGAEAFAIRQGAVVPISQSRERAAPERAPGSARSSSWLGA